MSSAGAGAANPKSDHTGASQSTKASGKRDFQSTLEFTGKAPTAAASSAAPAPPSDDPKRRRTGDAPSPAQVAALDHADHTSMMEIDDGAASSSRTRSAAVASSSTARRRAHSPQAKKKMVIKPFKVKPQLAAAFEEDTQTKLTNAVEAVYQQAAVDMSQEELYRAVEALCIHNKAPQLYEKLVAQCEKHVAQLLQTLADELQPPQTGGDTAMTDATASPAATAASHTTLSVPFLQHVQSVWTSHCDEMLIIRGIFLYLDRTYVIQLASASTVTHNNNDDPSAAGSCHQPPPKSLWDMGLGLFGAQLKKHPLVEQRVISGILALIERERNGESVNRSLLKSLLRMFTALKLYSVSFQPKFLHFTSAFYSLESARTIEASTPIEYIHYIQQRLQHEEDRAQAYLDESTRQPLTQLMQEQLIRTHAAHMLGSGFKQLLDQKRTVELGIMYKLFERIHALDQIRDSFGAYVKQTAGDIVTSGSADPAETPAAAAAPAAASSSSVSPAPSAAPAGSSTPATMILDLLKLKMTLDELLNFSFSSNSDFVYALKQSFEHALNLVENKPAEMMAKFIDKVLRTGGKGIKITSAPTTTTDAAGAFTGASGSASMLPGSTGSSLGAPAAASLSLSSSTVGVGGSEEVESLLDQVMFLFRYIHGKDVFQAFYKKDLAKRLLLAKSASEDAEKSMISKIKSECGASFTTKLEGMFKDMDLSKETQREYEAHRAEAIKAESAISSASDPNAAQPMELTVQVLTTGSWPAYVPMDLTLPKEVLRMHEDFKAFYLNKHSGRKLIWHHPLATAILRAHFPKARKELAVSGMQAVVLMLFNDYQKLSMEDIGKFSGITDVMELKKTLASLTFSEDVKLLLKEPRNKKLVPTDVFSVNIDFAYKLFRIKVNTVQMKETKEEQKSTTTRVFEDRQYALDASIVRIMKARKTLSHQLLIMEVIQQSKFPTKPPDIKKRIASLIEREYMERDKENSSIYNYMA